ncbi:MAG: hypothetical protein RLZZ519_311, partial [Bacteroidota bacterium]
MGIRESDLELPRPGWILGLHVGTVGTQMVMVNCKIFGIRCIFATKEFLIAMKKRLVFGILPLLLLCFAQPLVAQLFTQPQPMLFERGFDQFAPPPGTKRMVLSRYIPGARFPKDYDVVVETYDYNPAGQLLEAIRFQNITGELSLQTSYTYAPEGHVLKERVFVAADRSEIIRNYTWEKDANGKFTKATITDKAGKAVATVEVLPDGSVATTETSVGNGKTIRSTVDAQQRLLKMENGVSGQTEAYAYYPDGSVKELSITGPKGVALVKYENKLDDKGRVVMQTETGKSSQRSAYFTYNEKGQLTDRATI